MPKVYSEDERAYITKRLKQEAAYCLTHFGIRRTTVDQLVQRVMIPKGTFYLFYKSKELLLFEVLMEQHEQIESTLFDEVKALCGHVTCDSLTELLYRYFKVIDESGLLRLITTGEIELLYRKLPQQVMEQHFSHDNSAVQTVMKALSLSSPLNADHLATAFRNLFISMIHKREMGEAYFDEALKLTLRGLVLQMLG